MAQTLENIVAEQSTKLGELKLATNLIKSKEHLLKKLFETQKEVSLLKKYLDVVRGDLQAIKESNQDLMNASKLLKDMEDNLEHMDSNLPPKLLHDYAKLQTNDSRNSATLSIENEVRNTRSTERDYSDNVFIEDKENKVENCAKKLFGDSKSAYRTIQFIDKDEFVHIPKYMIGRQTLDAVNNFVAIINEILKAKYSLIALGKNGAKRKGEFDLYMNYIKQESTNSKELGKVYFFTAEDYQRQTNMKLDKTKLNLLTVLRHCKRIRDVRSAKTIQYTLV